MEDEQGGEREKRGKRTYLSKPHAAPRSAGHILSKGESLEGGEEWEYAKTPENESSTPRSSKTNCIRILERGQRHFIFSGGSRLEQPQCAPPEGRKRMVVCGCGVSRGIKYENRHKGKCGATKVMLIRDICHDKKDYEKKP